MNISNAVAFTRDLLAQNSNPEKAKQMSKYMKDKFRYFGITSPERKILLSEIKKSIPLNNIDDIMSFAKALWKEEERELHYIGLDLLMAKSKKLEVRHIPDLELLVTTHSWWDTVDGLAANCLGEVLRNDKQQMKVWAEKWVKSDDMWLQRTSLIFQLRYKDKVAEEILFSNILTTVHINEFFIRKAAGWALRQYSKFNPEIVRTFIQDHPELSGLTIREGSKYL